VTSQPVTTAAHFPLLGELSANPYWALLAQGLEEAGVTSVEEAGRVFGRRWLLRNRGRIHVLHFHYVQQFYAYEHTHARTRWVLRLGLNLLLARLLGYRTVFTLHNLTPTYPLAPAWVDGLGHRLVIWLVNGVIVHCQEAAEALSRRYGRRRGAHLVTHPSFIGVYPAAAGRQAARARLGLRPEQTVFLFFGGLRPNKGLEHLVRTFRRLPGEDLVLLIAGKPQPPAGLFAELEELARGDPRVRLDGRFIPGDEVAVYMGAADAVVLPFSRILTSSSAMLAMSFARPVIAPAMGCLPELVSTECGLLYDWRDPEGLAKALLRAGEVDLEAMGACGRRRVEPFTVERFGAEAAAAYRLARTDARYL
jgi:beta-1,4-mannosyltransferase